MGSTTATSTWPGPGINSVPFLDDATGLECIVMGPGTPTLITVQNLGNTSFNFFFDSGTEQCGFIRGCGNRTLPANGTVQIDNCQGVSLAPSQVFVAQDVGPGVRHIRVSWPAPAAPCAFGTRIKGGFPNIVNLTPEIIAAAIVDPVVAAGVAVFIGVLQFFNLDLSFLCGTGPGNVPPITIASATSGFDFWLKWFQAVSWPYFCECVPGVPPPTPFPPVVVVLPPGLPTAPSFPCQDNDPCVALVRINQQLAALQSQNAINANLLTLLQRYALPFAYLRGRRFSTLTATGAQSIERAVGLLIEVIEHPATNKTLIGAPEYIFDLGWVSVLTPDGMLDEIRLTRTATTWLSKLIPSATAVGWGLREGVTIEITELLAEP